MKTCYFQQCEREPETSIQTKDDGIVKTCGICATAFSLGVEE